MSSHPAPLLRAIADLDSPQWGDERTRLVWLEGTAIGLQLVVDLTWLLATAMVWVGQRPLLSWAVATVALVGLSQSVVVRYVRSHRIPLPALGKNLRMPRQWPRLLMALLFAVGALRAVGGLTTDPSFAWGMVCGAAGAVTAGAIGVRRSRRAAELPPDDTFDGPDGTD